MDGFFQGISFRATNPRGGGYLLTPLYRGNGWPGGSLDPVRTFDAADCVGLMTENGQSAERIGKGWYRLLAASADGETELLSHDPHAP